MLKADVFVRDQITPDLWPKFSTLLRTAYAAADELVKDNPILQVKSAEDNKVILPLFDWTLRRLRFGRR